MDDPEKTTENKITTNPVIDRPRDGSFLEDLAVFTSWFQQSEQLDAKSTRAYRRAVFRYAEWFQWYHGRSFALRDLGPQDLQHWPVDEDPVGIRGHHHRSAPATRNKHIAILRVEEAAGLVWGQLLLHKGVAEIQHIQGTFDQIRSIPIGNLARKHASAWKERATGLGWVAPARPVLVSQKGGPLRVRSIECLMTEWGATVELAGSDRSCAPAHLCIPTSQRPGYSSADSRAANGASQEKRGSQHRQPWRGIPCRIRRRCNRPCSRLIMMMAVVMNRGGKNKAKGNEVTACQQKRGSRIQEHC